MRDERGMNELLERLSEETDKVDKNIRREIKHLWEWGIGRIRNDAVRKSVRNYYIKDVPFQFFVSFPPGKYRVPWHNVPGGLIRHLVESCEIAEAIMNSYGYINKMKDPHEWAYPVLDIVRAATLITDTQKCAMDNGEWGGFTVRTHGERAAKEWERVAARCNVPPDYKERIIEAATWHYGLFTPSATPKKFSDFPDYVQIVHLADNISSSKCMANVYRPVGELLALGK